MPLSISAPAPLSPLEPVYLFIDAEHLRSYYTEFARAWFGNEGQMNFQQLKNQAGAIRLFYYDSLDDRQRRDESSEEFQRRVEARKAEHAAVRAVEGAHVRLGTVTGERRRQQKQVDILLAVDMMNHAVRQNMKTAVLITGDQDFKPVVDSLVLLGTFVRLWGAAKHTSPALIDAADSHRLFSFRDYYQFSAEEVRTGKQLPNERTSANYIGGTYTGDLVANGKAGNRQVLISHYVNTFHAYVPIPGTSKVQEITHPDYERLKLFLTLEFGPTENL
jgi:uncharacterized LabA/DUF88 family protein